MLKKYRKFGLRRDFNLSDLPDPKISLTNILNDLAFPNETYDVDDLFIALKGENSSLSTTNVQLEDFTELGTYPNAFLTQFEPLITIKDTIDNFKVFSGEDGWISGGDGLKAIFIPEENISNNDIITKNSTGDDLFNNSDDIIGPEYFWSDGSFIFNGFIKRDFNTQNGMIQWEGYFSPGQALIKNEISVSFNGLFLAEQNITDTENGWETLTSIYSPQREITFDSANTETTNIIEIGNELKYVGINDELIEINGNPTQDTTIIDFNIDSQTITLSDSITINSGTNTLKFSYTPSPLTNLITEFRIKETFLGDKIKIRFTVWWDDINFTINQNEEPIKIVQFDTNYRAGFRIPFHFFYSQLNESAAKTDTIEYYYNNHLSYAKSKTKSNITSNEIVKIDYQPPLLVDEKYYGQLNVSYEGKRKFTVTSGSLPSDLKRGDYIVLELTSDYAVFQISKIKNTKEFFVEESNVTEGSEFTCHFFDVSGLVGIYERVPIGTSSLEGFSLIAPDLFDIFLVQKDQLIFAISQTSTSRLKSSTTSINTGVFTIDSTDSFGASIGELVAIYQDAGLRDQSQIENCRDVIGKVLVQPVSANDDIIFLNDVNEIDISSDKLYVQFSTAFEDGTEIIGVNSSNNSIEIFPPAKENINQDYTITISPTTENREYCVLPLNTAPPFTGTETGLKTVDGLEILSCNILNFENLTLKETTSEEITNSEFDYSETLDFQFEANNFSFLIK